MKRKQSKTKNAKTNQGLQQRQEELKTQ